MSVFNPIDYQHLIGQWWQKDGYNYKLVGIMDGYDDWYWVMCRSGMFSKHTRLLSCVGSIEDFGFEQPLEVPKIVSDVEEHNELSGDSELVFKDAD